MNLIPADLKARVGSTAPLSEGDVEQLWQILESPTAIEVLFAAKALLRPPTISGLTRSEIARAVARVLAVRPRLATMEERFAALWAVMYVPADLYETPTEDFVYDCVRVEEPAIRGNAVILVGKLARIGNARAMGLLRELAQDADEIVRTNATINLRAIETKEPHA